VNEAVLFPDAVAVAISWLELQMGPNLLVPRVPNPRPARMVLVRRLGGPRLNIVADDALLGVEAWDETEEDAHDLAQTARGYLLAMRGEVVDNVACYRVADVGGPSLLPDPESDQPRYVFTVQAAMRGTALTAS
jgi:hypothetical protein